LIIGLFGIGCRSYIVRPRITQPSYMLGLLRGFYHRDSRFFLRDDLPFRLKRSALAIFRFLYVI